MAKKLMSAESTPNPAPGRTIEEHGIIGNLETAALVASDGVIDFLCWPRFDSPTVFAGLLDPGRGGSFELMPELEGARTMQLYLPDTNVLVTRWLAEVASVELVDLISLQGRTAATPDPARDRDAR